MRRRRPHIRGEVYLADGVLDRHLELSAILYKVSLKEAHQCPPGELQKVLDSMIARQNKFFKLRPVRGAE